MADIYIFWPIKTSVNDSLKKLRFRFRSFWQNVRFPFRNSSHRSPKLPQKPFCCEQREDEEKEPTELYQAGGGGFGEDCGTGVGGGSEGVG